MLVLELVLAPGVEVGPLAAPEYPEIEEIVGLGAEPALELELEPGPELGVELAVAWVELSGSA